MAGSARVAERKNKGACPVCGKPVVAATRPFCSARCRTIDLARWLDGSYAVPAVEVDDVDEEELAAALNPPLDR